MKNQYLETGEIVSTHGIRGEVKVYPWADSPEVLLEFDEFRIGGKIYEVEQSRVQKNCVLLKLKGVDTVEQAMAMKGQVVEFDRTGVELEEGWFIVDLIGLEVVHATTGEHIGVIGDVLSGGVQDLYSVKLDSGKSCLVPAVPAFVKKTSLEEKKVWIEPIKGLFDDAD